MRTTRAAAWITTLAGMLALVQPGRALAAGRVPVGVKPGAVTPTTAQANTALGSLPVAFEPNKGQAPVEVKAIARGHGYQLYLTSTEIVTVLGSANPPEMPKLGDLSIKIPDLSPKPLTMLHKVFTDASPTVQLQLSEGLPGKVNYLIGKSPSGWHTDLPTFATATYKGLWAGIDMVIHQASTGGLQYDFIVAPGADPSKIQMNLAGQRSLSIDGSGALAIDTGRGIVHEGTPHLFQGASAVPGGFKVTGTTVGFWVGAHDTSKALVIDPPLTYSTYLGGGATDYAIGIAIDASGSAYVTGVTVSPLFPTKNPFQGTLLGSQDAFVSKLTPGGNALVYSTFLGGAAGVEYGGGIVVNGTNAFISGITDSSDFPTMNPFQGTYSGGIDLFVTKLSTTGTGLVYSTYLGGSSLDAFLYTKNIAVNAAGNAVVTGFTTSTDFPTLSPLQPANAGGGDAFITKLSPGGSSLVYSTYFGGSGLDGYLFPGAAMDAAGNVYVTGTTTSPDLPLMNPFDSTLSGGQDASVTKINANGSALVFSTYLGGSSADLGTGVAVDSAGNSYVTGFTSSADFPTMNPFQGTFAGGSLDQYVTKLSPAGSSLVYSTYLGGSGIEEGLGIAVDSARNAHIQVITSSLDFPTVGAFQPAHAGGTYDSAVTKLSVAGNTLIYSSYLGGSGVDEGFQIAADCGGNSYVVGLTTSTDFPTKTPFQGVFPGGVSGYVTKVGTSTTACGGSKLTVVRAGTGFGVVNSSPAGISCGGVCTASFAPGTNVFLYATPATGSKFVSWSGAGCVGTSPQCRVIANGTQVVVATFAPAGGGGTPGPASAVRSATRTASTRHVSSMVMRPKAAKSSSVRTLLGLDMFNPAVR